jgi:Phosphopantetheine attachment site.
MDETAFLTTMLDILQRDEPLSMGMPLSEVVEWDSLAAMAVIAFAAKELNKNLKISDLKKLATITDLHRLLFAS